MNTRGWAMLVLVVALVSAIVVYWTSGHAAPTSAVPASSTIQARFNCADSKWVDAVFDNENQQVRLTLSDGRTMILPRARSADGARYANADESIVFWNVGDTATLSIQGTQALQDCAVGV